MEKEFSDFVVAAGGKDIDTDFDFSAGEQLGLECGFDYSLQQPCIDLMLKTSLGQAALIGVNNADFNLSIII